MRGGLQLIAHKERSTAMPITQACVPKQLSFSVIGEHATDILVSIGDRVLLGQPLAHHNATTAHASVSGTVHSIHSIGNVWTIVIDNDGRDESHSSIQPIDNFNELTPETLRERIARAGIAGLGGAAFSTATKLLAAAQHHAQLLIINAAECEPFITCDDALMREYANDIVLGTQGLLHACRAQAAVIAIEANKPEAIAAITKAIAFANEARVQLRVVANYYPTGGERQLVKLLTGNEVPSGAIPPDIGVLCQNVGTAAAIARLVKNGEPLISRVVTVTGSGVMQPRNLLARFGTPIESLVNDCGGYTGQVERLIMGGTMMGVALASDQVSVTAATNCIIAATAQDLKSRGTEMPCIRCGECAHACPASLLPQQLLRYARLQDHAALMELGLSDCIECGCCDYVCPSQIPLTSIFVAAKP